MIDLTPLDVRKKRGDFRKVFRGYDPEEVDTFLEVVAERLEALVKEKLTLEERVERLQEQVEAQEGRQEAVREALVTAQELRKEMREQARREADLLRREAEARVDGLLADAERRLEERREALEEMERMRLRFLKSFRTLLERQLDAVEVEEGRTPLEETPLEIDFTVGELRSSLPEPEVAAGPGGAEDAAPAGPVDEETAPTAGNEPSERLDDELAGAAADETAADVADEAAGQPEERPDAVEISSLAPDEAPEGGEQEASADDESLWLSSILKEEDEGETKRDEDGWTS